MMRKWSLLLMVFLVFTACKNKNNNETRLQGNAFGTQYNIVYFSQADYTKQIDSIIENVNRSVSTYLENSDISKINKGDTSIVVDKTFSDVFKLSEEVYKKSNGYFDPTVGVLRNAYGFGDEKPLVKIDSVALDSMMQMVGFNKVKLTAGNQIKKQHPNIYIDFNAVAKGYGIDLIGEFLESKQVENYLVELGGEIRVKGKNLTKNKKWVIGIEGIHSELKNRSYTYTIHLTNEASASSGNYRKFRIDSLTGKRYVHTINPLTGSAEKSGVTSATVIANTCAKADAYATTLMAMGYEKSKTLLKNTPEIEAYFTYIDEKNQPAEFMTSGFEKRMTKEVSKE